MSSITIELGEQAPSVNHIWKHRAIGRGVMVYVTKEGKEFKERLGNQVPEGFNPFKGACKVTLDLTFADRRQHNIDNSNKAILDALNNRAYVDDEQIQELLIRKHYEKGKPNIKIVVEEI